MRSFIVGVMVLIAVGLALVGCDGGKMPAATVSVSDIKSLPHDAWEKLEGRRIIFGHQSVGNNIIAGIQETMLEKPEVRLRIVESDGPAGLEAPGFVHFRVGKNEDPASKIDHFADRMVAGVGDRADIAFFKFCYVDITGKTQVEKLFSRYKERMEYLKAKYPKTTFVHVTVPLTVSETTFKTRIKKWVGKEDLWEYEDNIKRNEFNKLLRETFGGKEPLFDLANAESTFPDGKPENFSVRGDTYQSVVPAYSSDGGHLNETGRKIVAKQLLAFLARLSSRLQ